jgi:hypothetical protein
VRQAMKSRQKQPMPQGFEDRLKAYFENKD